MKHPHDRHQGFSLLEVMIALAIFSIAIVALYGIQTITISQNFSAGRITTANAWGAKKLEDLMALKYDDVINGNEASPDGVYTVDWTVAEDTPLPNTKTILVVVTSQRAGTGSRVELEYVKHDTM